MLSQRKENIPLSSQKRENFSKSVEKGRRTSVSIRMLKDMMGDVSTANKTSVKQIKLEEGIVFLNKKIDKQCTQIIFLTDQLKKMREIQNQTLEHLNLQKQKNKKYQSTITKNYKNLTEAKKKAETLQIKIEEQDKKRFDLQNKLLKCKDILRKKEQNNESLQTKLQSQQHYESIIKTQKEQILLLRERFFKLKEKNDDVETQNVELKQKMQKMSEMIKNLKEELFSEKDKNINLEKQNFDLEDIIKSQEQRAKMLSTEFTQTLTNQNKQIDMLRGTADKIQQLTTPKKDYSVYVDEIKRLFKQYIKDKHLRGKVEKEVLEVVVEMQERWQQILVKSMATCF